jgi:hypothetical protein
MLTTMTDADWTTALKVFKASRSRRGDKGRDDKKFLSALHYFAVRTSPGGRCLPSLATGTACETVLAVEPIGRVRGTLRLSLRAISAQLAQRGFLNERGHPFAAASVRAMLS